MLFVGNRIPACLLACCMPPNYAKQALQLLTLQIVGRRGGMRTRGAGADEQWHRGPRTPACAFVGQPAGKHRPIVLVGQSSVCHQRLSC